MTIELPDAIDCRHLADEAGELSGSIARSRLKRVRDAFRVTGPARVRIGFGRDDRGRICVDGTVEVALEARCQRCLEWMGLDLRAEVAVIAVTEAEHVGAEEDTVPAPGGRLALLEMVEDEILLACPMIPAHDAPGCRPPGPPPAAEKRYRPFAGLGELMNRRD